MLFYFIYISYLHDASNPRDYLERTELIGTINRRIANVYIIRLSYWLYSLKKGLSRNQNF